ncbi:MAG TPA: hypothetical protein VNG51_00295 [Ktedonobacteraceae bacterium]|nr:hypothetical protein [Ktedonobacteraceae bacterium]
MSDQNNGQSREEQRTRSFNPNEHIMQLKSKDGLKDYLPVQWRLVWFREQCPNGTIETEIVHLDLDKETEEEVFAWNNEKRRSEKVVKTARGIAVFHATVKDGKGGVATGTKSEKAASFPDYIEKAETGAIGRALAALGYGTQFTGEEFNEEHRIVDSPVERTSPVAESNSAYSNGNTNSGERKPIVAVRPTAVSGNSKARSNNTEGATSAPETTTDMSAMPITDQQLSSIRKLSQHLSKAEPEQVESMSYGSAKEVIAVLSQEYRQSRSKAS